MAGVPTGKYILGIALQSGEGQPADSPQHRVKVTGTPSLRPNVERGKLEETGTGVDGGERETTRISTGGQFNCYARSLTLPLFLYGGMGAKSVSGTAPNLTHLLQAVDDKPWFTIWVCWGGVLVERYDDCRLAVQFSGSAGQTCQLQVTVAGKLSTIVTDEIEWDPYTLAANTDAGVLDTSPAIRVPDVVYLIDGDENADISEFTLNVDWPDNTMQTTKIYDSIIEPGQRTIGVNFTETAKLATYLKIVYADDEVNPSQEVAHVAMSATFKDAKNIARLKLTIPNLAYMTGELPANPNNEIGTMPVTGEADPPASGSILSAEVYNSVTSYPAAS